MPQLLLPRSGIRGKSAHFDQELVANILSKADNASLSVGGSFTITGWVYLDTKSTTMILDIKGFGIRSKGICT